MARIVKGKDTVGVVCDSAYFALDFQPRKVGFGSSATGLQVKVGHSGRYEFFDITPKQARRLADEFHRLADLAEKAVTK